MNSSPISTAVAGGDNATSGAAASPALDCHIRRYNHVVVIYLRDESDQSLLLPLEALRRGRTLYFLEPLHSAASGRPGSI